MLESAFWRQPLVVDVPRRASIPAVSDALATGQYARQASISHWNAFWMAWTHADPPEGSIFCRQPPGLKKGICTAAPPLAVTVRNAPHVASV